MGLWSIVRRFKRKDRVESTGKVFLGRRFEAEAAERAHTAGYRILRKNWHLKGAEIDLLLEAPDGSLLVVEVRGSQTWGRRPSQYFDKAKQGRVLRAAEIARVVYRAPMRVELWECYRDRSGRPQWQVFRLS